MREIWDRIGISASLVCVAHCLLTPLLVLLVPVVGEIWSHNTVHIVVLLVVLPVAVWALWNGYRLHKHARVLWLGGVGVAMIIFAMFFTGHNQRLEIGGMIVAGLILAAAHYTNLRSCRTHH